MFVISGSTMVAATGAMHAEGRMIGRVLDMVYILQPVAGKFAVVLFLFGVISAGVSSIFPIAMICPLLIADYREGKFDTNFRQFRILAGLACVAGLTVSIFGSSPIAAQIATQVAQVFVLPLVIIGVAYLVNRKQAMGRQAAGILLNLGLAASLFFALLISYKSILALVTFFNGTF